MSRWIRQIHRWLSIAFVVTVLVNIAVLGQSDVIRRTVAFLPLLPLALLLLTGLYLFALPHATKWRRRP